MCIRDSIDTIDYVTLASEGTAIDYGNLTAPGGYGGCAANQTRAVWRAGERNGATSNVIDFIQIASGGNAQDFGDAAGMGNMFSNGMSDSHGGLGGY